MVSGLFQAFENQVKEQFQTFGNHGFRKPEKQSCRNTDTLLF